MALPAIIELVKNRLPFASDIDAKINDFTLEAFYLLQDCFGITDADVEDESKYKDLQRSLIADYVSLLLIQRKAVQGAGGNTSTDSGNAGKGIKKAKADVVETEFIYAKASDGTAIMIPANELIAELKQSICSKGRALKVCLPFDFCEIPTYDAVPPFLYFGD